MIVIPMLGNSSRFFKAGYDRPKYELELGRSTVLRYVIESFENYLDSEKFTFAVRSDFNARPFVTKTATASGVKNFEIIEFSGPTNGQATSVAAAIERSKYDLSNEDLVVFNADSFIDSFSKPSLASGEAGCLDVFTGTGDHWSFVEPGPGFSVRRTAEKQRISHLCSNGLYTFDSVSTFIEGYRSIVDADDTVNGEFYVAPLYNHLIARGMKIKYRELEADTTVLCGTPDEYEELKRKSWSGFAGR